MRTSLHRALAGSLIAAMTIPCSASAQQQVSAGAVQNGTTPSTPKQDPRRAKQLLGQGEQAEAAGRSEEALKAYDEAARLDRSSAAALERGALLRTHLVKLKVDEAERLAILGETARAVEELRAALRLDPGNAPVAERLGQLSLMVRGPAQPSLDEKPRSVPLPELEPRAGKHSFDLRGDTRAIYEQVAGAFGLKVIFDAELPVRNVRLRVGEVDFATAITVVNAETATFLRPVDEHTFLVAADTPAKRKEYQRIVEDTIELPDSVTTEEMTELLRALRDITGMTHVKLDARSRTFTIRDTPENVALGRALIEQVEQARGELMLDIELLEVDRNAAERLGITPPSSARILTLSTQNVRALQQATSIQTLIGILLGILSAQGLQGLLATGGGGLGLPPVVAFGGGFTTFFATMPSVAAQFSQALSLVKTGRRVLLRAQDGKPASLFVGDRFPVSLSLLSSGVGTTGSTQAVSPNVLPRTDIAVGKFPIALAAVDLNNDGQLDLAVLNLNDSSISILLNQGNGNFAPATGSPIVPGTNQTNGIAIATADLDRNGTVDLLVANQSSNNVTLLLGKGDGTFAPAGVSPIATGNQPSAIVVADFNGDNNLDFAVANFADNTVSVFLGDGNGGFTQAPGSPIALGGNARGPIAMVFADFNNDGKNDLAVVDRTTNQVSILLGNGDGTFAEAPGSPIAVGKAPVALALGDLNGDGRPDLAVVNAADNSVTILLNNGDATFSQPGGSPLATGGTPSGVAIASFRANGVNDIVVAENADNTISVFLGLGAGLFTPRFALRTLGGPSALAAADFNGDGFVDVAVTEETANDVSVVFNPVAIAGSQAGAAQQPYPSSDYVDLGFKVKATPRMHPHGEVTLQLEFELRALSGLSVNGIPILTNRTISQTIRVREDETTLISGLLDTEETRTLSGLPGFSNVPDLGYLTSTTNTQPSETELLILVTPRRLRMANRVSRSLYTGREGLSTGAAPQP
jgi:Flp pilus assembly secretin CpaC